MWGFKFQPHTIWRLQMKWNAKWICVGYKPHHHWSNMLINVKLWRMWIYYANNYDRQSATMKHCCHPCNARTKNFHEVKIHPKELKTMLDNGENCNFLTYIFVLKFWNYINHSKLCYMINMNVEEFKLKIH